MTSVPHFNFTMPPLDDDMFDAFGGLDEDDDEDEDEEDGDAEEEEEE